VDGLWKFLYRFTPSRPKTAGFGVYTRVSKPWHLCYKLVVVVFTCCQVSYEVTIEVKECPADRRQWNKTFQIYPVGLTEKLTINLQLNCECACEKSTAGKVPWCVKYLLMRSCVFSGIVHLQWLDIIISVTGAWDFWLQVNSILTIPNSILCATLPNLVRKCSGAVLLDVSFNMLYLLKHLY